MRWLTTFTTTFFRISVGSRLRELVEQIAPKRVLVCGDLNIDQYTFGRVQRISPEAPVPVLQVESTECRPGSAGNAALNLVSLGQQVMLLARIGEKDSSDHLMEMLRKEGIGLANLCVQRGWETPVKNRLIASSQQMIRVDTEEVVPLSRDLEADLCRRLPDLLNRIDLVAISDYGKGFLTPLLLRALIATARERGLPVVVDPKGRDFSRYAGATLIKPNQSEAYDASGLSHEASLDEVAARLHQRTQGTALMITRSEKGISLFSEASRQDLPTQVHEVRDVTGAGDTVLAMTGAALANRLPLYAAAQLSNLAASLAVERFGCARISCDDLRRRLLPT